jgi:hypothetical protein
MPARHSRPPDRDCRLSPKEPFETPPEKGGSSGRTEKCLSFQEQIHLVPFVLRLSKHVFAFIDSPYSRWVGLSTPCHRGGARRVDRTSRQLTVESREHRAGAREPSLSKRAKRVCRPPPIRASRPARDLRSQEPLPPGGCRRSASPPSATTSPGLPVRGRRPPSRRGSRA